MPAGGAEEQIIRRGSSAAGWTYEGYENDLVTTATPNRVGGVNLCSKHLVCTYNGDQTLTLTFPTVNTISEAGRGQFIITKDGSGTLMVNIVTTGSMNVCLLYTSPSPRDRQKSRMPSSA